MDIIFLNFGMRCVSRRLKYKKEDALKILQYYSEYASEIRDKVVNKLSDVVNVEGRR